MSSPSTSKFEDCTAFSVELLNVYVCQECYHGKQREPTFFHVTIRDGHIHIFKYISTPAHYLGLRNKYAIFYCAVAFD